MSQKLSAALSELQSANLSLQKDIDRERELDKQRMILFSAVSHELKTPITVLQGQLDGMLQNLGSYKDRDKYLARSLSITKAMESMVQEIVTISRIDSPDFTLHIKKFDLSEVIREIITKYIEIIEQKKMKLEINIADELIIDADKKLIEKAVSNLINNAISYSPDGEKLIIHLYSRDEKIQFSICNTGSHISEKALP
ncbi:sensor histidine kinase [Tissierella carlieri]|uniref:sensor histidine kinase n=1 Tax=Tissierella carlieri TaxID=689904 RepID=UPI001C11C380|nr:HAMP domain-containing sensor histidine kinase [Tissierella carlieri]